MALISIRGLRKYYRMGESIVHALDGVDLDIEKGEFVAITGASGSGKSTMMHLLGCLDRPTAGTYHLNGRNVSQMSDRELARVRNQEIGFVFQTFNLINRTSALDNVGVPRFYARAANTHDPARRALERVGLNQRAHHTPSELSGGERQRVAIARAIVNDPLLVLADEPTGNLDTRTGEQIMEIFRSLNQQGVTIILVTHEQDVALQARRIVQMRDGKIVLDKPTAELVRESRAADAPSHAAANHAVPAASGASGVHMAAGPLPIAKQKNHGLMADFETPEPVIPPATIPHPKSTPDPMIGEQTDASPADQAAANDSEVYIPPAVASGSTAVCVLGVITPILLLIAVAVLASLQAKYATLQLAPGQMPPTDLVAGVLAAVGSLLISIILGCVSFFWGRAVRRKIRTVPGNWIGSRRTLVGMICGGGSMLLIILWIGLIVVSALVKLKAG